MKIITMTAPSRFLTQFHVRQLTETETEGNVQQAVQRWEFFVLTITMHCTSPYQGLILVSKGVN